MKNMRKTLAVVLLSAMLMSACAAGQETPLSTPQTSSTQPSATAETEVPTEAEEEVYTVIFDKNTTPDDLTDDESFTYYTSGWGAQQKSSIVEIPRSDTAYLSVDDVPTPSRKGYYFAGWHTKPVITEEDIVNGVSKYQVFFGEKVSELGAMESAAAGITVHNEAMYIKDFETLTDDGTLTLYARWVEAKEVSTEQELRDMANDLYGAYVLTDDIVLTEDWTPIGTYFNNYTYYNDSWWVYAFRGTLDGNGHTISGLTIHGANVNTSIDSQHPDTIWHEDGDNANGTAAFFGAICGAKISNLTIADAKIDASGEFAYSGDYCYAAPLACFDMISNLKNIHIINPAVKVEYTDEVLLSSSSLYLAASGLEAGGWNSTVSDCTVESAVIEANYNTVSSHGGQVFVGGMIGECFATMKNNAVDAKILVNGQDCSEAAEDQILMVNVGGISAANTSSSGNTVRSDMTISVSKPVGASTVNVGGYSGSQKYMSADNNTISASIQTDAELDPEQGQLNVGAVLGRFDPYYITLILRYANGVNCGAGNNVFDVTYNGSALTEAMSDSGKIHLNGEVLSYIATRDFTDENGVSYKQNADAIVELYGSYVPRSEMVNDILFMNIG